MSRRRVPPELPQELLPECPCPATIRGLDVTAPLWAWVPNAGATCITLEYSVPAPSDQPAGRASTRVMLDCIVRFAEAESSGGLDPQPADERVTVGPLRPWAGPEHIRREAVLERRLAHQLSLPPWRPGTGLVDELAVELRRNIDDLREVMEMAQVREDGPDAFLDNPQPGDEALQAQLAAAAQMQRQAQLNQAAAEALHQAAVEALPGPRPPRGVPPRHVLPRPLPKALGKGKAGKGKGKPNGKGKGKPKAKGKQQQGFHDDDDGAAAADVHGRDSDADMLT